MKGKKSKTKANTTAKTPNRKATEKVSVDDSDDDELSLADLKKKNQNTKNDETDKEKDEMKVDSDEVDDTTDRTKKSAEENDESISLKTDEEEEEDDAGEGMEENKSEKEAGSKKTPRAKKSASDDSRITRYRRLLKIAGLRIASNKELDALKSQKVWNRKKLKIL